MRRGRRLAIAGAVALGAAIVALVLTAVIGPGGESQLAEAAERMRAQSAVTLVDMAVWTDGRAVAVKGRAETAADGSRKRFRGTFQQGSQTLPVQDVDVGGDSWLSFPDMPKMLPAGKRWVHIAERGTVPSSLTPVQLARLMLDAAEVEKVSDRQRVDGVLTTEYEGRIGARDFADEIGGQTRANLDRALGSDDVTIPIRAWIGPDGRVRRLAISGRAGADAIDAAFDFVRYGVKVDARRPPVATVVEQDDWLAYLRRRRSS